MTYKLFLDDERFPIQEDWTIARSFEEAREIVVARGVPTLVSFDHDLGDGPTGRDFAQWLIEYILDRPEAFDAAGFAYDVHSQNPVGAANIRGLLDGFLRFVEEQSGVGNSQADQAGSTRLA